MAKTVMALRATDSREERSAKACHRNFGPGNFGPGDQNFQWKIGPAGPIFSGKMVRLWKIGPNNGPSISALVTSDCCG